MDKNKILINEYKNGNEKAYYELIKRNLYLIDLKLNSLKYNKDYEEDLIQDGFEMLMFLIKKYSKSDTIISLNQYLNTNLTRFYISKIEEYNNNNKVVLSGIKYTYSDNDFIDEIENKDFAKKVKDFILKTNYLNFSEKICVIAKYGLIGNFVISNTEMAKIMNCTSENIRQKINYSKEKIKKININNIDDINNNYKTDIFSFLNFNKIIVMHFIKQLNEHQIEILKEVWGYDFEHLNDLDNILLSNDEIFEFLNIMQNLYIKIKNLSVDEMIDIISLNGFENCYLIKR